ncbi:MAG: IPTL-CTERM sorting domain-containing protein [Phycisphaerae bacterium]|nr:IPTL-CTERM sorting domain-containing protein [Phycisphaerae bacterium]
MTITSCFKQPHLLMFIAAIVMASSSDKVHANKGKCARMWVTNLHYNCAPAGANCGGNCTCKDVAGNIWRDCYCLAPGVTSSGDKCEGSGSWRVVVTAGVVAPNSTASFELQPAGGNVLEIVDHANILPDGTFSASQTLTGPTEFAGTFQLSFGSGPPDQIPVEIVQLNLTAASITFLGNPTGPNSVTAGPSTSSVQGNFDSTTGIIQFDDPVPAIGTNNLFPSGREILLRPALAPNGPDYDLLPSAAVVFAESVPTTSEWGLAAMALLVLSAATALFVGRRIFRTGKPAA